MLTIKKLSNNLIGCAGEYFVAGELSRHGIVAALTMAGTDAFDILAINPESKNNYSIQVKTTKKRSDGWLVGRKAETLCGDDLYYAFVLLPDNDDAQPEYYIVPSEIVSRTVQAEHRAWLETPGRGGRPHQDNSIRVFRIEHGDPRYCSRWDYFK